MRLKKCLCAAALAVATLHAYAQSSVTLYGSIDEGVGYATNEKGGHAATMGPDAVPDFFGFKGTEDLGGGTKALFKLENGYLSNTGSLLVANTLFSRIATVGLSGNWGTLTLGRQFDLINDTLSPISLAMSQYSFYLFHPGNLDNLVFTSVNNSVKYVSPVWGGLSISVLHGLDDSSTQAGPVTSVGATYARGPLHIAAVYTSWHDRLLNVGGALGFPEFDGQSLAGGQTFRAENQTIGGIGATYAITQTVTLRGLIDQVDLRGAGGSVKMRNYEAGANVQTSPFNMVTIGGYLSDMSPATYREGGIGDVYSLSKQTIVYAQAVFQSASGANAAIPLLSPSSNSHQAVFRVGVHHFF